MKWDLLLSKPLQMTLNESQIASHSPSVWGKKWFPGKKKAYIIHSFCSMIFLPLSSGLLLPLSTSSYSSQTPRTLLHVRLHHHVCCVLKFPSQFWKYNFEISNFDCILKFIWAIVYQINHPWDSLPTLNWIEKTEAHFKKVLFWVEGTINR